MASATLSMAAVANCSSTHASLQVSGKGFAEYSGLKNSIGFPCLRKYNEDLVSVVAFQTNAIGSSGQKRGIVEAKIKVAINGFGRIGHNFLRC